MFQTISLSSSNKAKFKFLYDTYAPKVLGFLRGHAETREKADETFIEIFTKVSLNLTHFDTNAEKKILHLLLTICKSSLTTKHTTIA